MQVSTVATIPALSTVLYESMVTANQAVSGDGSGAVIARITMGGVGVAGLIATPSPVAEGVTYYDGTTATAWSATATGTFGAIWVPGLMPGTVQLTLTGSHEATLTGIPIYADTVTFALAEIQ
jgi:hypothetical protein